MKRIGFLLSVAIGFVELSTNCNAQSISYHAEQFHEVTSNNKNQKVYEADNKAGNINTIGIAYLGTGTAKSMLAVQMQVFSRPVTIEPLEIIASKTSPEDDIVMCALTRAEEKSSYRATLYRMVNTPNGLVTVEVDATFKYSGLGKSTKEFQKIKGALVSELFSLSTTK
jgi:uncharacterized protein YbcC (UPF0753/DUF2309 family)